VRLLGLDLGEKRIGVALSDLEGMLARPLEVIQRRSRVEDFTAIGLLIEAWDVERVVVGLPLTAEGLVGPQARRVKRYTRELARTVAVPIEFVDESFSTADALVKMREAGRSRRTQRDQVDAAAAAVILQSYLDHHRGSSKPKPTESESDSGAPCAQ
jgi:putative Holliday junction resolvase